MDTLLGLVGSYWGSVTLIFFFCFGMSYTITWSVERYEKAHRKKHGREKALWWPYALRGISTIVGLASAPPARYLLYEILIATMKAPEGTTLDEHLVTVLPSWFVVCFVGFCTGFFLTVAIWFIKSDFVTGKVRKVSPGLADKIETIPEIGAPTNQLTLTPEQKRTLVETGTILKAGETLDDLREESADTDAVEDQPEKADA
jgi:hypothetical protein